MDTSLINTQILSMHDKVSNDEETRGFNLEAGQTWIYPTNYPEREYQFNITEQALQKNTMVCLPTGLGKTFIAAVVMYNYLRWYPQDKIIFLAPSKPLVRQQIEACYNIMAIPKDITAELTGTNMQTSRAEVWASKRVFFATPQVLQNDLDTVPNLAEQIKCIVFDEAHKARGNYAYCDVIKKIAIVNKYFRVLALSATPGNSIRDVGQVCQTLLISHLELRTEESQDVKPYIFKRTIETVVVPFGDKLSQVRNDYINVLDIYVRILIKHRILQGNCATLTKGRIFLVLKEFQEKNTHNKGSTYSEIVKTLNICIVLYHGFEVLERHGLRGFLFFAEEHGDKNLLKNNEGFHNIMEDIREYLGPLPNVDMLPDGTIDDIPEETKFGHPKYYKLFKILLNHFNSIEDSTRVIVFCEFRESVKEAFTILLKEKSIIKPRVFLGQGAMTQKQQISVMDDFRKGICNTLIATCIGEEGLDVGDCDLIVCFDISNKSPIRIIQRMGRTGRKRQGKVVMLVTEGKEQQILHECLAYKNVLENNILNSKELLRELYKFNPKMIPDDMNLKCHKIFITVTKPVQKALNNNLKTMFKNMQNSTSLDNVILYDFIDKIPASTMFFDTINPLMSECDSKLMHFSTNMENQRKLHSKFGDIQSSDDSKLLVSLLQSADCKRFNVPSTQIDEFQNKAKKVKTKTDGFKQGDIRTMFQKQTEKITESSQTPIIILNDCNVENNNNLNELNQEISNYLSINKNGCKICDNLINCDYYGMQKEDFNVNGWVQPDMSILNMINLENLNLFNGINNKIVDTSFGDDLFGAFDDIDDVMANIDLSVISNNSINKIDLSENKKVSVDESMLLDDEMNLDDIVSNLDKTIPSNLLEERIFGAEEVLNKSIVPIVELDSSQPINAEKLDPKYRHVLEKSFSFKDLNYSFEAPKSAKKVFKLLETVDVKATTKTIPVNSLDFFKLDSINDFFGTNESPHNSPPSSPILCSLPKSSARKAFILTGSSTKRKRESSPNDVSLKKHKSTSHETLPILSESTTDLQANDEMSPILSGFHNLQSPILSGFDHLKSPILSKTRINQKDILINDMETPIIKSKSTYFEKNYKSPCFSPKSPIICSNRIKTKLIFNESIISINDTMEIPNNDFDTSPQKIIIKKAIIDKPNLSTLKKRREGFYITPTSSKLMNAKKLDFIEDEEETLKKTVKKPVKICQESPDLFDDASETSTSSIQKSTTNSQNSCKSLELEDFCDDSFIGIIKSQIAPTKLATERIDNDCIGIIAKTSKKQTKTEDLLDTPKKINSGITNNHSIKNKLNATELNDVTEEDFFEITNKSPKKLGINNRSTKVKADKTNFPVDALFDNDCIGISKKSSIQPSPKKIKELATKNPITKKKTSADKSNVSIDDLFGENGFKISKKPSSPPKNKKLATNNTLMKTKINVDKPNLSINDFFDDDCFGIFKKASSPNYLITNNPITKKTNVDKSNFSIDDLFNDDCFEISTKSTSLAKKNLVTEDLVDDDFFTMPPKKIAINEKTNSDNEDEFDLLSQHKVTFSKTNKDKFVATTKSPQKVIDKHNLSVNEICDLNISDIFAKTNQQSTFKSRSTEISSKTTNKSEKELSVTQILNLQGLNENKTPQKYITKSQNTIQKPKQFTSLNINTSKHNSQKENVSQTNKIREVIDLSDSDFQDDFVVNSKKLDISAYLNKFKSTPKSKIVHVLNNSDDEFEISPIKTRFNNKRINRIINTPSSCKNKNVGASSSTSSDNKTISYNEIIDLDNEIVEPQKTKKRKKKSSQFDLIDLEAEEASDASENSEYVGGSSQDKYDESFVHDEEIDDLETTDIHAHYLQTVRSPIKVRGAFKLSKLPRTISDDIFSQAIPLQESYVNDSFCVNEEIGLTQNDMSELEIAELLLKEKRKRKKKNQPKNDISKPKRRRIVHLSEDSD